MLKLKQDKNILVLAAHPDDETLGCGGTLKRLSEEGSKINLLTFTDGVGSRNNNEANRNKKLDHVSEILGISEYTIGDFPDNAMDSVPLLSLCKFIEKNVTFTPDLIFTHFHEDLNVDHQLVAKATLAAFRPQTGSKFKIYSYYIPSSTDYNFFSSFDGFSYFEIGEKHTEAKNKALKIYDKEMRPYPHSRSYDNVNNLMKTWGCEVGVKMAEKFKLILELT
jgi:N-acetylglucosamine malate deacetylase 1